MRARLSLLVYGALLFSFAACGDDGARGVIPKGPAQVYATAVARINTTLGEVYKLQCKCSWEEEGFESEAECLNEMGDLRSFAAHQRCMIDLVEGMRSYEGDLEPIAQCHESTSLIFQSCGAEIDKTCSDESFEAWNDCASELFMRNLSCMSLLEGADTEWLDEFSDKMTEQCAPN